ncbi:hypothetical protein DINM_000563 [Dirofilaria immitis]|nr:hypothetical protein [Dirofilaria immitis]
MDRYGLLEHVRQRILRDENKSNNWKNHGVEKVANKARKFRVKCHKVPPVRYTFEESVLRKAESIRTSVACKPIKQCCRGLKNYENEDIAIITRPYNSMQSLYTSENVSQVKKSDREKSMECFRNRHFSINACGSGSWTHKSLLKSAEEEPEVTNANGFLPNSGNHLHLLHSERFHNKNKMDEIKKIKVVQPQVSQHINLNIDSSGHSSCGEINVKIKQSFNNLNNLEGHIDKAARFLQASFSNRLSISSMFECSRTDDASSSKNQDTEGVIRDKTSSCRVKARIAYGRNTVEMNQHLRNVHDAFSSQLLLHKREVSGGRNSSSNEKYSNQQSSFYATVQQRMNKALQHNPLSNNMYKSQSPLKERNCDPLNLSISSFSKMDSVQKDDAENEARNAESEVLQAIEQQTKTSDMRPIKTLKCSTVNGTIESNKINKMPTYSSQELLKREHYANNTVKALRQFYRDSMLYFVELRKLYRQRRIEDLWKVENEEERIKAACLMLKRKYINSIHNSMSLKNLVDYHLHETARIQLLNLDLQKHLILLRKMGTKIEDTVTWLVLPFCLIPPQTLDVQNLPSYNKNLQQLREELKWKRKEADFLKKTFDQRVMRNDLSEENSLKAQIDAHVRYITETEKDIAELVRLQNEDNDNNEKTTDLPVSSYENYPASSSRLTSVGITAERFSDGKFSEFDGRKTSFNADIHSTNKFGSSERNSEREILKASICHSVELSPSSLTPLRFTSLKRFAERALESNHIEESCNASNEILLPVQNKLLYAQDIPTIPNDPTHFIIHSPGSNHSSESVYGETTSFKQDISKEALLISAVYRSDSNSSKVDEHEQSVVQQNDTIDENETAADGCNLHSSIVDEQFFTPLPSDIETDNEEKADDFEERRITSQESSSSFHTTVSSLTPNIQTDNKQILSPSSKSRKFKLTVSPLSLPGSPVSARYAASMPREDSSRSATSSPHTPKTISNRCISPLSASLLESLLEDSLTTMLALEHSQTLEGETFVHREEPKKLLAIQPNYLRIIHGKVIKPEDLIPGLDLSGVNSTESEANICDNDSPSKLKESNISMEVTNDKKSNHKNRCRYHNAEIHSISEQIWNLANSKQPLEILINGDPKGITLQEMHMRQIMADRCCEIVKCCFKNVGHNRYMGLTNINCSQPRNPLHLESILQKSFRNITEDAKEKKRWELLSRSRNSDIENIVLEELYAEQNNWEDILENYEDEVKAELVAELWHEQLDESLSSVINL